MSTFGQQTRRAWTAPPSATAEELERESAVYLHAGQMARNLAVATREIAALQREVKHLRANLAAARASSSKETKPMADVSDAVAAAMERLERIQEQKRGRRRTAAPRATEIDDWDGGGASASGASAW